MSITKPDTKTALLDAAEALFANNGIDGSSMRAISRSSVIGSLSGCFLYLPIPYGSSAIIFSAAS